MTKYLGKHLNFFFIVFVSFIQAAFSEAAVKLCILKSAIHINLNLIIIIIATIICSFTHI